MKVKTLFAFLFTIIAVSVNAQEWTNRVKSKNPTFQEVQKAFYDYWDGKVIEKGSGYKQFKRWEWYWEQRIGKDGVFPKSNILWEEMEKYNKYQNAQKLSSVVSATTANWTFKGPSTSAGGYFGIGRINCIAFHPTLANTFWVGTPAGGLWKTTDGGSTWSTNTDNLPVLGVSDIAIDPTNPNIMYLATGDGEGALSLANGEGDTKSIGVLKSTNGGTTWTAVLTASVSQNILIRRLIISPSNPQVLLAATSVGIYRTANGGVSWSLVSSTDWFMDLEFKPTDPNYVYATTFSSSGNAQIFTSTNNGVTWAQVTSFTNYNRINVAVSANSPSLVDALCSVATGTNANGFGGLWFSSNSGASFSQYFFSNCSNNLLKGTINASGCGGQGFYDLAYALNPTNANEIWLGGVNTWRSTDGGSTFSINNYWTTNTVVPNVHADKHFITHHPLNTSFVYECNDGGLYGTNNGGASWFNATNGMGISQIYKIGTSATVVDKVVCGLQDNSTKMFSGAIWSEHYATGDGMESIIDYTNSNIQYVASYKGEIYKTINNGGTWAQIVQSGGTGVNSDGAWVTPYVMHPTNNSILLVGKAQVYQTTNGGSTWSQLGTLPGAIGNIISMAYAPSNPSVIYVATASQFFKTINGGGTWTLMGTSGPRITYIAVDPTNPNRIWETNSGYVAGDKVWFSSNGGVSWTNFSGSLPNIPVNCIVYQNSTADGLYIGTDVGVYFRDASMADWIPYNTGLPNVVVNELEISYNNNKLWAATFGRGLWNSNLYCATPSQPGVISGLNNMCAGVGATSYSIVAVPNATSYVWTLPAGWSGSSSTNNIIGTPGNSGIITVAASNSCGLSPTQNIFVTINSLPSVNAVSSTSVLCVGQSATLNASGANSYTWNPGGIGSSIVVSPSSTTTYTLSGVDGNGCVNSSVYTQVVSACTSVNSKHALTDYISIFPNPFNDYITLISNGNNCDNCIIEIYNTLGSLIHKSNIIKEKTEINLSQQSSGIYFIKISSVGGPSIIKKLIKE